MRILRIQQVLDMTGLSRSTLYLYVQNRSFPPQVQLGEKIVGWVEDEVKNWIREKILARDCEINNP